jgi:hypothetical protein
VAQPTLWAGVDAGKAAHHCVVINADGQRVLSRRVVNDEAALTDLIRTVKDLAGDGSVQWAIDLNSGGAALLITLLLDDDQDLLYIPGRTVHQASAAYRGDDGKTDLLTELSRDLEEGCVRRRVRPVRFAARDQRWGCASGVSWAGGVAAGLSRGDGRSVPAVSAR